MLQSNNPTGRLHDVLQYWEILLSPQVLHSLPQFLRSNLSLKGNRDNSCKKTSESCLGTDIKDSDNLHALWNL